ncbi:MAG: hypothetical protein J6W01_00710 [Bacteroidales bacterium]|nr:hypothetical protein [Bacteroidales bacterium]
MIRDGHSTSGLGLARIFAVRGVENTANLEEGLVHKIIQRTMRQGTVFIQNFLDEGLPG